MLTKTLFTLLCLVLPVLWGVVVDWLFDRWGGTQKKRDLAPPEYQI
ncbi:hypothetical protein [Calycomorphotria hydatis]|uniref:Uncharacterized protein n=1 Tax=Calycomorphotria hydatis TaxID=2528027 RepID=A0A517T7I0_9PLAN|nr:hypothetical protein [Calycomorphotria hydatis]QDT64331.1 hypothetical protein V22_15640 [Calycomorphotria hydatis]